MEITSLELKREIRDGVADLVSLLNELTRMSEISYGWSIGKKVETRILGNRAWKRTQAEQPEMK